MDHKEEYATFNNRIKEALTAERLQQLGRSLDRLFDAGIFTPSQYQRLDHKIMEKGL